MSFNRTSTKQADLNKELGQNPVEMRLTTAAREASPTQNSMNPMVLPQDKEAA